MSWFRTSFPELTFFTSGFRSQIAWKWPRSWKMWSPPSRPGSEGLEEQFTDVHCYPLRAAADLIRTNMWNLAWHLWIISLCWMTCQNQTWYWGCFGKNKDWWFGGLLLQLSSVIPDNVVNPIIIHPQVFSISMGGILTIPKWYVVYSWISHTSPLVFECRAPLR